MNVRIPTTKRAKEDLNYFHRWTTMNGAKASSIAKRFDALPAGYQRRFLLLIKKLPPEEAIQTVLTLKTITEQANNRGYTFTTKQGLRCTIKRLDKTEYSAKVKMLEEDRSKRGGFAMDQRYRQYIDEHICTGSYLFTYKMQSHVFGTIYWLTAIKNLPSLRLLTTIKKVKNGQLPKTRELFATFHDEAVFDKHDQRTTIVLNAIKRGILPTVMAVLTPSHPDHNSHLFSIFNK